jgi:hypothetical protein
LAEDLSKTGAAAAERVKESVEEVGDEQMKIGAEHMQRVSSAIGRAAEELGASSPLIAHYARSMASGLNDFSDKVRNQRARDLLRDATDYARREPMVFFGTAVLAGFALSRFLKSSNQGSAAGGFGSTDSQAQ